MGKVAFPYNNPNANRTIIPTLVRVFIWSPRMTKMGSMTQIRSVTTPKAILMVSNAQRYEQKDLPLKALVVLERSDPGIHRANMAGFQTASNGMHWKQTTRTVANITRVRMLMTLKRSLLKNLWVRAIMRRTNKHTESLTR